MHIQPHSWNAASGERGHLPALFKNLKSVLIFERKALIVSIFGLNFTFKMLF